MDAEIAYAESFLDRLRAGNTFTDPFDPTPKSEHAALDKAASARALERVTARGLRQAERDGVLPPSVASSTTATAHSPVAAAPVSSSADATTPAVNPGGSRRRPRAVVHSVPKGTSSPVPSTGSARKNSADLSARRQPLEEQKPQRPWSGNTSNAGGWNSAPSSAKSSSSRRPLSRGLSSGGNDGSGERNEATADGEYSDALLTKANQWNATTRSDGWRWEGRPSHRDQVSEVALNGAAMDQSMQRALADLEQLQKGGDAFDSYLQAAEALRKRQIYAPINNDEGDSDSSDDSRLGPPVLSSSSSNDSEEDDDDERAERVSHGDSDSTVNGSKDDENAGVGFFLTEFDHRNPADFNDDQKNRKARKPGRLAQGDDDEDGDGKGDGAAQMYEEGEAEARYNDCVKLQEETRARVVTDGVRRPATPNSRSLFQKSLKLARRTQGGAPGSAPASSTAAPLKVQPGVVPTCVERAEQAAKKLEAVKARENAALQKGFEFRARPLGDDFARKRHAKRNQQQAPLAAPQQQDQQFGASTSPIDVHYASQGATQAVARHGYGNSSSDSDDSDASDGNRGHYQTHGDGVGGGGGGGGLTSGVIGGSGGRRITTRNGSKLWLSSGGGLSGVGGTFGHISPRGFGPPVQRRHRNNHHQNNVASSGDTKEEKSEQDEKDEKDEDENDEGGRHDESSNYDNSSSSPKTLAARQAARRADRQARKAAALNSSGGGGGGHAGENASVDQNDNECDKGGEDDQEHGGDGNRAAGGRDASMLTLEERKAARAADRAARKQQQSAAAAAATEGGNGEGGGVSAGDEPAMSTTAQRQPLSETKKEMESQKDGGGGESVQFDYYAAACEEDLPLFDRQAAWKKARDLKAQKEVAKKERKAARQAEKRALAEVARKKEASERWAAANAAAQQARAAAAAEEAWREEVALQRRRVLREKADQLQGEVEAKVKARRDEAQAQARKIEAAAKARHAAAAKVSAASTASGTSASANASLKGGAGGSKGSVGVGGGVGVGKGIGSSGGQAGSEGGDDGNNNYNGTLVAVADPQREMSQAERAQMELEQFLRQHTWTDELPALGEASVGGGTLADLDTRADGNGGKGGNDTPQSQSGFSGMFGGSLRGSLNSLEELSSSAEPHLQLTNGHPAAAYEPSQNHNDDDDDDDSDGGGGGATQIEEQSSHSSSFSRRGESNSNRNSNGAIRGAISPVPEEEQGEDEELEQQEYGPTRRIRSRQQQVQVSPVVSPVRSPVHAQDKRGMNGDADNDVSSGGAAAAAGAAPLSPVPPLNLPPRHSTTGTAATAAAPSAPASSSSSFASSAQVAAPTTSSSKAFLSLEPWDRFERSRAAESAHTGGGGGGENSRVPFFDMGSTATKGRFRVHDARGFASDSMRRHALTEEHQGVVLLLGRRPSNHPALPDQEQVITVMFDRDSEVELSGEPVRPFANAASAEAWWHRHKLWLLGPNPV